MVYFLRCINFFLSERNQIIQLISKKSIIRVKQTAAKTDLHDYIIFTSRTEGIAMTMGKRAPTSIPDAHQETIEQVRQVSMSIVLTQVLDVKTHHFV